VGHVLCTRLGALSISRYAGKGLLKVMTGDGRKIRWIMRECALQTSDGCLVVPGVPDAQTDVEAMEAVKAFEQILLRRLAAKHRRNRKGVLV
jgi:hypothetical protein